MSSRGTLHVVSDPGTTVIRRGVYVASNTGAGAHRGVFNGFTGVSGADGIFSIPNVPTIRGNITASASVTVSNVFLGGSSLSVAPVPGGVTDVGMIVVIEGSFERSYGASLAQCDDCFVTVDLPFAFPFSGSTYSQVFFDGNGRVSFNF